MFVSDFVAQQDADLEISLREFLDDIPTVRPFDFLTDGRELPTGTPSRFLDLFIRHLVPDHASFGSIYIRLWLVGRAPKRLIYGLFLGAERAQQSEPRRGVALVRDRLHSAIDLLERRGFTYRYWADADISWGAGSSVRAVTRQLEQFITFKERALAPTSDPDAEAQIDEIQRDIRLLVETLDENIEGLFPLRSFGQDILLLYYGQNLPPAPTPAITGEATAPAKVAEEELPDEGTADFPTFPMVPALGALRGMDAAYAELVATLSSGKHALLIGPPGVGKTELAETVCRSVQQPYETATATSDWTTVHTIGGYLPVPLAGGGEPLDFVPGIITQTMSDGRWLIVDEMNRADVDKAFGELFTLLGGSRKSVSLPYRKRQSDGSYARVSLGETNPEIEGDHLYRMPTNWRMIGTMNTFDKASLYQTSFALLRRFGVIEIGLPEDDDYKAILQGAAASLEGPHDNTFAETVLDLVQAIFVPPKGTGLDAAKLRVGPAIPLDVIRYAGAYRRSVTDPVEVVLSGIRLFLFPQFEGRFEEADVIAKSIADGLGLAELPAVTMDRLRTFTGAMV